MTRTAAFALCLSLIFIAAPAFAEDWPGFRGPSGQGLSADANPPTKWSETENVAWKAEIPGAGWSSPIVSGERVFLTAATENGASCRLLCIARANGKVMWDVEVFRQQASRKEGKNSYATPTPVTDGKTVYVAFAGGLAAVGFDGKVIWRNTEHVYYSRHGIGASPILYKETVILPFDGSNPVAPNAGKPSPEEFLGWQKPWDKSYVLALNKADGTVKWKAPRALMTRIAHVTPMVIEVAGERQLISPAGDYVEAMNPDTGEPLWWAKSKGETPVPSVVFGDGLLYTTSGYEDPTIRAVRPGTKAERGDLTASHIAWEDKKGVPMLPSFLFVEKPAGAPAEPLLFAVKENGIATCREPKTGKIHWQERVEGTYSASPIYAAGKVYFLSETGKMTIIEASKTFKVIGENSLNAPCQASPAFADGQVFIRTDKNLFCIGAGVK